MAKNKVNNPHDKFVKEMFGDIDMAKSFLKYKLPQNLVNLLDFETVVHENTTFVSKELKDYFADLIFKIQLKHNDRSLFISVLVENKSIPDEYILFQLNEYLGGAYRSQIRQKQTLRPVIPFIYYHGNEEWNIRQIPEFFPDYPKEIHSYLPKFQFEFLSLRATSDEEISSIDNKMVYAALMMQKYRHNLQTLEDILSHLFQSLENYTERNFLYTIIVYSLSVTQLSEDRIIEIAAETEENLKNIVMSTYENILEKGIQKGIAANTVKTILNSFDNDVSIPLIANITELSEKEVIKILKENGRDLS